MAEEQLFIVQSDYYEDLKNGRGKRLLAKKGQKISMAYVRVLGLVKDTDDAKSA